MSCFDDQVMLYHSLARCNSQSINLDFKATWIFLRWKIFGNSPLSSEECVNIIIFNDSLVSSSGCWLLVRRFSNINVVSSHKEVVVCRSAAGPFRACLDLFFCQNGVFKNQKGITPNSSGLLGWRPSSKGLGVLKNSFLIVFFKSTNS